MSTVEMQIAERAREFPDQALTNLHQFIDEPMLQECFNSLNRKGASGVDRETWAMYDKQKEVRIPELLSGFKSGKYRAPNIRRVHIPKGDGQLRPLGIPTVEDKLLQTAVSQVLTPVYEAIFHDCSFGFRPGKSQHQALEKLFHAVSFEGMRYIIDADMKNYFGSINHQCLREFLDLRINDGVVRKMLNKWLKAGILEAGNIEYPTEGTPQGGSISPLLSNLYLHYALDEWFIKQVQPLLKGKSFIIRFADDFLLGFTHKEDANRVMEVLPNRLGKYGLTLHPDKTKLITLEQRDKDKPSTFDFLGFTHFMGSSRKGKPILKRKTSGKKFRAALKRMDEWTRNNRHKKVGEIIYLLNQKLRGHYGYYGITFNYIKVNEFYEQTKRRLHFWLNRRGGKRAWNWDRFTKLINDWIPLLRPKIYHSYV
jgi:group II intron reverse transcriptase/maturase